MTTQEQIAALAAELNRIGKMPCGDMAIEWDGPECPYLKRHDWHHPENGMVEGMFLTAADDVILSALLGVAAEVLALADIVIRTNGANKFQIYGWLGDSLSPFWFGSYSQAVIAALKQIESEVKNDQE